MRWLYVLALLVGCDYVFRLDSVAGVDGAPPDGPPPVHAWKQVSAGDSHTCAIATDDSLWCWGANGAGESGQGSDASQLDIARIGDGTWQQVSSRGSTTCGIQSDGSLWCWGADGAGQVGDNMSASVLSPWQVDVGPWAEVEAGDGHTCAIKADQTLWCWGRNGEGQIGDGTVTVARRTPIQIAPSIQWAHVTASATTSCAIDTAGALYCWGKNNFGQYGVDSAQESHTPLRIGTETWQKVSAGSGFTCGITTSGQLMCAGANNNGQLGDGSTSTRVGFVEARVGGAPRTDWIDVAAGWTHVCARTADGAAYCWGLATKGRFAGDLVMAMAPIPFDASRPWSQISAGVTHTCAITDEGTLWCRGSDGYGECGDGGTSPVTPVQIGTGTWAQVAPALSHLCALDEVGTVSCAGDASQGNLGGGTLRITDELTAITPTGFSSIESGQDHTCGIKSNSVLCWGANYLSQLGIAGGQTSTPTTVRAGLVVDATQHTCTIDPTTKHLWCWGYNDDGQVGTETPGNPVPTPFEVGTRTWTAVGTGVHHTCAVEAGTSLVYCFGDNTGGAIGNGSMLDIEVDPVTTMPPIAAAQLSVGGFHTCAIDRNNVAYCWGHGYDGQLGLGTTAGKPTPTALAGAWKMIGAANEHTCGVQTDGTLWCWGENDRGQLGIGTRSASPALVPTQVGSDTDWESVSAYKLTTCALKTNKTLWCWGDNAQGQLGNRTGWRREPVQVP